MRKAVYVKFNLSDWKEVGHEDEVLTTVQGRQIVFDIPPILNVDLSDGGKLKFDLSDFESIMEYLREAE